MLSVCTCRAMLADAEVKANQDQAEAMNRFRSWATKRVPGAQYMNVGSGHQIRQLLFAGVDNQKPEKGVLEHEKVFKVSHDRCVKPYCVLLTVYARGGVHSSQSFV